VMAVADGRNARRRTGPHARLDAGSWLLNEWANEAGPLHQSRRMAVAVGELVTRNLELEGLR
jgi:hypothetical protein